VLGASERPLHAEIAVALTISVGDAKTHVSKVMDKLGCTSRLQAAVLAQEVSGLES
jgi:DNA-binding NarL/FixJ family response regulator